MAAAGKNKVTADGTAAKAPPTQRLSAATEWRAAGAVPAFAEITLTPTVVGRVPRRLGFNVEIQENAESINLWDWIADSGAKVLREFHPQDEMRREHAAEGTWGSIGSHEDFEALRERARANPLDGPLRWREYRFDENIPWLGVPDTIVDKVHEVGATPMIALGYRPKIFPRPLVKDVEFTGVPDDTQVDWEAAVSAYEYYFAVIHHFAAVKGAHHFMMLNEPEFYWGGFYLPEHVAAIGKDWFVKLFRRTDSEEIRAAYLESLGTQYAVLARVARAALEDVRGLLAGRALAGRLVLTGPVTGKWESFWPKAAQYFDLFDYHHYSTEPDAFRARYRRVAVEASAAGKEIAVSEYNRVAGEMEPNDSYFVIENALGFADITMAILSMARPQDPVCDLAAVYVLQFPSTHRNYKQLLYGDMNLVDWTGADARLWSKGDEWHPTDLEMQVRFATPAYHMFRMLARCTGTAPDGREPHAAVDAVLTIRDSAVAPRVYDSLRVVAVDQEERLLVTILNTGAVAHRGVRISSVGGQRRFSWAVVRQTTTALWDQVVAEHAVSAGGYLEVDLPARSLVQVILSDLSPQRFGTVRIEERTATPGRLADLGFLQTTRLRAIAEIDGADVDITEHDVIWESSLPEIVRVYQGGLVQRVRKTSRDVTVQARLSGGRILAEVKVPACQ